MILRCDSDLFSSGDVPVITELSADQYEVDPGDTVYVSVGVEDSNDEALQYEWSAEGGQFIPPVNQSRVMWKAPEAGGNYRITVVVSNADGDSDPRSEIISVRTAEPPEILSVEFDAYTVDPGDTVQISVTLKETRNPVTAYDWTADGGSFIPPADQATVRWKAPAVGGEYQIRLIVSNSRKQSDPWTGTIIVRSFAAPYVEIISPQSGEMFRQYDEVDVTAIANHQNGIESVRLFLNDTLTATCNGADTETYEFPCELTGPAGDNAIRVEAVAKVTQMVGSDQTEVRVEGIVLGK